MRNLLILGMLLVAAFMAGWFQINREGDRTTIEINRSEIRGDARNVIDRGREFLDRRDEQYADQQYADQQYADQQQQPLYDEQGRAYWPQPQIASQQDQWGSIQQQSYDQRDYPSQQYADPNYAPYQQFPQTQQPVYPPLSR